MTSTQDNITNSDLLAVLEAAFSAGLREVRRIKGAQEAPLRRMPVRKDAPRSRMANAIDVLTHSAAPMHVMDILAALEDRGITATRDGMVSALTKALAPHGPIQRPAPNTFWIAGR
jgi:hypothetical protein